MVPTPPTGRQVSPSEASAESATSTRDAILEAGLYLFTEQGFDKTSLREVADRVGVTKAALYYHFRSKEELLTELVDRAHGVGHHGLAALPTGDEVSLEHYLTVLSQLVDEVLANRRIFALVERNRTAVEALGDRDPSHSAEHEQMAKQWAAFIANRRIPLRVRVRVSAAFGVVMAGGLSATRGLGEGDMDEVGGELKAAIRDVLRLGRGGTDQEVGPVGG